MRDFPSSRAQLLESPFLVDHDWTAFTVIMEERLSQINEGDSVLCAEEDPIRTLAVLFATLLKRGGVFLGNPHWKDAEWDPIKSLASFDRVYGNCPVPVGSVQAPKFQEARIMIPTGGTSGGVRFCVHTLNTLSSAVARLFEYHGSRPLSSICPLGVFHISGLMPVLRACLTGGRAHMLEGKALEAGDYPPLPGEPCSISLVPTQLNRLIRTDQGLQFLHSLDTIYVGGAPVYPDLLNCVRAEKLPVLFVYGMTESAAMVVAGTRADSDSNGNVWGNPLPGVSISLTADHEIVIRANSLFRGYFPVDEFQSEYRTGDVGRWTVGNELQVLGRKDFLINTGGEKVNPEEVEMILDDLLPDETLAVGSHPDSEWGERVVAVLESELDEASIAEIRRKMESCLAPHKIPKVFMSVNSLPKSASGKVDRMKLRSVILGD